MRLFSVPLPLKHGDLFATANPSAFLGRGINAIQKWNSRDNESVYSHAGVILFQDGDLIESLWQVQIGNLYERYVGTRIIIARYVELNHRAWMRTYFMLLGHRGGKYPWWRLPLHVIPPLAKYLSFTGMPVCSELVAKAEYYMGARHRWWTGTCPDTLVDEWTHWKGFEIIFEGVCPGDDTETNITNN
jgi:hypothetical protein